MDCFLQKAFAEASKLPEDQQEAIASLLLQELASDRRWSEAFLKSQDQLADMADRALREYEEGRTKPFEQDSDLAQDSGTGPASSPRLIIVQRISQTDLNLF